MQGSTVRIAAGGSFSAALADDGQVSIPPPPHLPHSSFTSLPKVRVWGRGDAGELGAAQSDRNVPTLLRMTGVRRGDAPPSRAVAERPATTAAAVPSAAAELV